MNLLKFLIPVGLIFGLIACSTQESKLESILDKRIGRARIIERTRLELDSMLGKANSKLKDSVLDFISARANVKYTDILVDGKKARVKVVAVIPKIDELNTLILMAGFMPRENMLSLTLEELMLEVSKKSRRPSNENIRYETYEFSVDFEKNKYWEPNGDQLSGAYAKRNLITKR